MNRAGCIGLLLATLSAAGCGKAECGRVSLEGHITLQGEAFDRGSVVLRPIRGTSGPASGGAITDGRFQIPAETGPAKGHYLAIITVVLPDRLSPNDHLRAEPRLKTFEREIELADDAHVVDWHL